MPARRRKQSNAMLYTLITFVGLFIATTTVAVIYYVKAEEYKTAQAGLDRDMNDIATEGERKAWGTIVGTKQPGKTWLGTMIDLPRFHDSVQVFCHVNSVAAAIELGGDHTFFHRI